MERKVSDIKKIYKNIETSEKIDGERLQELTLGIIGSLSGFCP